MGYGWYRLIHGMREAKYVPNIPLNPNSILIHLSRSWHRTGKKVLDMDGSSWIELLSTTRSQLTRSSELGREKMWARINLIPLLQAEEDRDQVRRYWADQAREKELLGENAKVYNTDR